MTVPGAPSNGLISGYDSNGNIKVALVNAAGFNIGGAGVNPVANMTALQALALTSANDGATFMLQTDGSLWRYAAASTLTTDTSGPFLVATATTAGAGAFLRVDRVVDLKLPIAFGTTDGTVLYTAPTGFKLALSTSFWEVTTSFTGGSSSAIGLKSSNAGMSTAGDVLGGSGGDVAATLVSTGAYAKGTVGAKMNAPGAVISGGDTIALSRITSAFTAGAGFAHVVVEVSVAPAA